MDYNSPDELLAVVDADDNESGALPRSVIHARGLLHRAVHVLVFDPDERLIIQQRSTLKDTFPLHWECVGGHLSPGENYREAAVREVMEELGVAARDLKFLCKIPASETTGLEFVEVFRAVANEQPVPEPSEIIAIENISFEQLVSEIQNSTRLFSPVFINTLNWAGFLEKS